MLACICNLSFTVIMKSVANQGSLGFLETFLKRKNGLNGWSSAYKLWLILKNTLVQFPAAMWWLTTIYNSSSLDPVFASAFLGYLTHTWCKDIPAGKTPCDSLKENDSQRASLLEEVSHCGHVLWDLQRLTTPRVKVYFLCLRIKIQNSQLFLQYHGCLHTYMLLSMTVMD